MTKNHLTNYIIPIIILAGTALAIFYLALDISVDFGISLKTFDSLSNGLASYISQVEPAWRPRLLSNWLASIAVRISRSIFTRATIPLASDPIQLAIGLWTMTWYSLTGLLGPVLLRITYTPGICLRYLSFCFSLCSSSRINTGGCLR